MTEKAEEILKQTKRNRETRRIIARVKHPRHRNHLIGDINLLDQDEPARLGGGDKELKILKEMNELQRFEDDSWSNGSV